MAACNVTADSKPSNLAEIIALTLTVNNTDYPVIFSKDKTATVAIPAAETIPSQVTVKTITAAKGAESPKEGESLSVMENLVSLTIVSEDQNTKNTYSVKLMFSPVSLTATQLKVTDGSKGDGSKKLPSNFMIFDIIPALTVSKQTPVQFLLVKTGDTVPSTPDEFQKTVSVSLTSSNSNDPTSYKNHNIVMAHRSILLPTEKTSLYLGHDSEGNFPLSPNTEYGLYALQPESSDLTPVKVGTFTTGSHPALGSAVKKFIEDPGTASPSGHLYMEKDQFFVWAALFGKPVDLSSIMFIHLLSAIPFIMNGAVFDKSFNFDIQASGSAFPDVLSLALVLPAEATWWTQTIKGIPGSTESEIIQFKVFK